MKNKKLLLYILLLINFTQIIHAQVPTYVPTNGLVGYWPFNGNANDESGNGNNGTVNGATLTTDRNGNANSAYSFDGNDLISILNSSSFNFGTTNNFTMSLWFKRQSTSDGWDVLLSYACPDGGGGGGLQLGTTSNFHLEFGSSGAEFFDGGNVNDTSWHMLTATFDRVIDIVKIYQDGQFISNINVPNTYTYTPTCNSNILIGGERNYWPQYYFNGQIDDIAIYNRALTQQEITNLYNNCTTAAPTAAANQTFCTAATIANLTATGTDVKWYATANDVTALAPSTTLTSGTYYASQTINGCESTRTTVTAAVNDAQITASASSICSGTSVNLAVNNSPITISNQIGIVSNSIGYGWTQNFSVIQGNVYKVTVNGAFSMGTVCPAYERDAAYWNLGYNNNEPVNDTCNYGWFIQNYCNLRPYNDTYNPSHSYDYYITANSPTLTVGFYDCCYGDNCGNISFTISEVNTLYLWSTGETTATINPTPTTTTTYWCDITANGVTCRKEITITVNPTTAPTAAASQTFCTAATVADLTATGTDVKWYATATDVTALAPSTSLTSGTYYASQTINGCESTRTVVTVAVNDAQITASATTVCSGTAVTITASANSANTAGSNTLPTNLQNGLVGYWPFNGNANDASGNGNNGTVNGATLTTDRFGNSNGAYSFDGVSSYITQNNTPNILTSNYSISIWFKSPISLCSNNVMLRSGDASNCGWQGFHIGPAGPNNFGLIDLGNNNYAFVPNYNCNNISINEWHNLVYTRQNMYSKQYIDGILVSSNSSSHYDVASNCPIFFGSNHLDQNGNPWDVFNGKLDDIAIYNRALSSSEIQQLYIQEQTTYLWSTGETTSTINPSPTATTTYWCDVTANGVTCRKELTITVNPTTAPTAATSQTFCSAATIADLVATGTDIKWYATANDTIALAPTTSLTSGTYYVSQTINGCESTRTTVTVAVNDAQITASATSICSGTAVTITAASNSANSAGLSSLPTNLQNGLVGYWPFNGNANDASGNGNNGTVNGATLTTDRFGNSNGAYSFDGVDDFISIGALNNLSTFSSSFWFNCSNSENVSYPIGLGINYNNTVDVYKGYGVALSPNAEICGIAPNRVLLSDSITTCGNIVQSNIPFTNNNWYNVVVISDGNSGKIYLNGNFVGYSNSINVLGILDLVFGKRSDNFAYFTGIIDDVTIYNRALTPQEITQLYTQGQTTYLWSTDETTATINPTPTATTTYWCDITANGVTCRKEMTITIPTITSHPSNANLCATVGASTTISVQDNISNANYTWQFRVVTATNPSPTWTNISTSNAGSVYSNYTTATLTITKTTTLPAIGTQYRVLVSGDCGISVSNPANITIISTIKAGTIVSAATVCLGGNITLTLGAFTGTSFQWQSAPISTTTAPGVFTDIAGATNPSYTISSATADMNKSYRVVVANSCYGTTAISPIKTIKVDPTSVGGTVKGGGTVCSLGGGTLSLSGNVGKIQWQYSTDGGVNYVNAPSATVGSSSNFTTTSASSIAATYVVANVSSNTLFRALVTSGVCSSSASNAVEFVLGTQAVAGTISAQESTICAASGTTLTLSGNLGSIVWQKSTNWTAATPTWAAVTTSVTPTLNTGALAATTAFRAKVTIGLCSTVYTDVTVITVSPTAKGGTVAVNVAGTDVCSGSSKAMKVTGNVGTIQWQMSTTSATAGFVDVAGAVTTPYTFTNITQPTWFRVVARSGVCTTTSASNAIGITVTTIPAVAGTISGVNSVCTATGSTLSLAGSTGTIVWQKAVAPFTAWTAIAGATTSSIATGNLTATTAYRAILTSGTCKAITDAYTVTVSPAARATAISGNALIKTLATAICTSATATLTLATGSIGTIEWQYYYAGSSATSVTNTSVVTWTPIVGATSAVYNASSDQPGNVWFRIKFTSGPCSLNAFSTPVNVWFKNCNIAKIETQDELVKTPFTVVAYPNPYSENFNLSLTTSSLDNVTIFVYDMLGKLLDKREVDSKAVSDLQVGDNYPSGVYNVIVTQGENMKTVRVVKR